MGEMREGYKNLLKELEEKKLLGVDGSSVLQCVLKQYCVSIWTALNWLRTAWSSEPFATL
jgi:hypothetical protein